MWLFKKKTKEEISRTTPGFEETERRTPKAGVILLLVMFLASLFFGWRALDDLGRIPNEPQSLSDCSYRYRKSVYLSESPIRPAKPYPLYYEYPEAPPCNFNDLEKASSQIQGLFARREPIEKELQKVEEELRNVERVIPAPPETEVNVLRRRAELLEREKILQEQLKPIDEELVLAYKPIFKEQNKRLRWYEFKVFLLQLIFTLPFFWIVFRWYLKLHKKDSPYTVISIAVLAVAAILLLRVVLFWFWGLFLERVLEIILEWFRRYDIVRTIISYLGMFVSIAIFGGAVYWLQKKVFDPRRVTLRRFRQKQCPHCQASLDLAQMYCPNCGHQVREKCPKCGEARFVGLPACPNCGSPS